MSARKTLDRMTDAEYSAYVKEATAAARTKVVAALTAADAPSVLDYGQTFTTEYGTEKSHAESRRAVETAAKVHTAALRAAVEVAYSSGALVPVGGAKVKGVTPISQRTFAKAYGVSQPAVSQHLTAVRDAEVARAVRTNLRAAAKEAGLLVKGESHDDVTAAISAAVATKDPDVIESAMESLSSGKVPTITPTAATVSDVAKVVARLESLTAGGVTVTDETREEARRLAANLRGIADVLSAHRAVTVRKTA